MKPFWIGVLILGLAFGTLFSIRMGVFDRYSTKSPDTLGSGKTVAAETETWMNIFQNGRKIGTSHSTFIGIADGYMITENIFMRVNTMGLAQDIHLKNSGRLNGDYSLSSFDFEIGSGRFRFEAKGRISGDVLTIRTRSFGESRRHDITLQNKIFIVPGVMHAVGDAGIEPGSEYAFQIFDPATMGQETVTVRVVGREKILVMGKLVQATRVSLVFKGIAQQAWIGEGGGILREEGLLGIRLERTTREDALYGLPAESSQDLTKLVSVASNVLFDDVRALKRIDVEIGRIRLDDVDLAGNRQTLRNGVLVIEKEALDELPSDPDASRFSDHEIKFLEPTPFVQADHPRIQALAKQVAGAVDTPLEKVRALVGWIGKNIEKRPVLSLPDALSTLENGVGDCNEHAVLLAALARASGIPAKIEAGLVYLNGRFYYHAWNLLYVGRWITADALFGQVPADVTHIRFASGDQKQQVDLIGIIGKVELKIIDFEAVAEKND